MKSQDKQIIEKLQAYDPSMVLKAFELYKESLEKGSKVISDQLMEEGWEVVEEKPLDKPFHYINGLYWVLSEEARQKKIQAVKQALKDKTPVPNKLKSRKISNAKTSMALTRVSLKCPECGSSLYKQKVCPACKEGKKGYIIRLICDDNPDHEFLL